MRRIIPSFCFALLLLQLGCASADQQSKSGFDVIDKSSSLGVFTDALISDGVGFDRVSDFSSKLNFQCQDGQKITLSLDSRNTGQSGFETSISGISLDSKPLTQTALNSLNSEIGKAGLFGPIAVRCSSSNTAKKIIHLTVRKATLPAGRFHYDFVNVTTKLNADQFSR